MVLKLVSAVCEQVIAVIRLTVSQSILQFLSPAGRECISNFVEVRNSVPFAPVHVKDRAHAGVEISRVVWYSLLQSKTLTDANSNNIFDNVW